MKMRGMARNPLSSGCPRPAGLPMSTPSAPPGPLQTNTHRVPLSSVLHVSLPAGASLASGQLVATSLAGSAKVGPQTPSRPVNILPSLFESGLMAALALNKQQRQGASPETGTTCFAQTNMWGLSHNASVTVWTAVAALSTGSYLLPVVCCSACFVCVRGVARVSR